MAGVCKGCQPVLSLLFDASLSRENLAFIICAPVGWQEMLAVVDSLTLRGEGVVHKDDDHDACGKLLGSRLASTLSVAPTLSLGVPIVAPQSGSVQWH